MKNIFTVFKKNDKNSVLFNEAKAFQLTAEKSLSIASTNRRCLVETRGEETKAQTADLVVWQIWQRNNRDFVLGEVAIYPLD